MTKITLLRLSFLISCFCFSNLNIYSQAGGDPACAGVSFFQKAYGGNKDEFGNFLTPTSDSGYVIVGQTRSFGNGGFDGLVQKVNKNGTIVWSKAIGGSADEVLFTVRQTSDNGFITVGQTKSFGNAAGDAWLVKLDASGNIQWSKKYGDGNINGEIAYDVVQLSDGGYAFCGTHRYTPGLAQGFVVRTDSQGNVTWAKQYANPGSDQLVGIIEDGNSLVVVGFFQGGSYYDGYVMKLDKANGAVQWMKGYDGENRSTWFSRITKTNNGYQVLSLITSDYTDTDQQTSLWNLDANGNLLNVRKVVIPGIYSVSHGWLTLADGGFLVANGQNNIGSDIILSRVNAAGSVVWSKKYAISGRQQIHLIQPSAEGGYVLVGNTNNAGTTSDSSNVFLMKVDAEGNAGTCSGNTTNELTVISPAFTTLTPAISDLGNVTIINPVLTANAVNISPVTNTFCYHCDVIIPPNTTCSNGVSLYQKEYGGNKDDFGHGVVATADSGFVITGQTNSFGSGGVDGYVMKVNKKGSVVWSKTVGGSNYDVLYNVKRTTDNGFITVGQTKSFGNTAGDAWLVKLDASGNVQWSKKYGDGNINGEIGFDVVQLSDGGYAFVGAHRYAPGTSEGFLVRTDGQGNVLWTKQYGMSGSDQLGGIVEDSNSLVVSGFYQGGSFYDGYVMKLNKTNGAVQWTKGFDGEGRSTWFSRIAKTNNGYQVHALITNDYFDTQQQESVWNIDVNGNLQNVRKLVIPGVKTLSYGWYPQADGGFIAANGENNNGSDIILCRVNAGGGLDWSKKFARNGLQLIYNITSSPEGGYAALGYNNNAGTTADSNNVYFLRVDDLGNAGTCSGVNTTDLSVVTMSHSTPTPPITDLGAVTINNPAITVNAVNVNPETNTFCFCGQSQPDIPVITASANPICQGSSVTLKITSGNLNDATSWKWYTGSCGGTLVGSGDSILVSPATTTTYYVRGEGGSATPGACGSLTITVTNQITPTFAAIGPRCQNSTAPVLPTTSTNGISGSWSPATINTSLPGTATYTFTPAAGQCGLLVTMAVVVMPQTVPAFTQIGPLCQNSNAPALPATSTNGITGTWSPASIITSGAGTTTYTFTPSAGQCAVVVTMDVVVNAQTTPVFTQIGPLCQNSNAPALPTTSTNGITGTWSPATINTAIAGTTAYTFTPTSGQCATTATMTITVTSGFSVVIPDVKPLNYPGIAYNTVYPEYAPASSITLTVNVSGLSGPYTYNWSTGETTQSITVSPSSTTTYSVTVTNANGCQATTSKEIFVQNVGCGGGHKVAMCHITGNPDHVVDICIDDNAVPTHLAAGCTLGECPGSRMARGGFENESAGISVHVSPNPTQNYFRLTLTADRVTPASMRVMDIAGRVMEKRNNINPSENIIFGYQLKRGVYFVEVTQGNNRKLLKIIKM